MGIVGFDFLEGPIKEEDRQLYGFDYLLTNSHLDSSKILK